MGAGASTVRRPPPTPSPAEVATLEQPYCREGGAMCIYCLPYDEDVKKRSSVAALEVGSFGFRLLRPASEDCLMAFPWGQIHSWAHSDNRFSFRFYDDGKKAVVPYTLFLRDLPALLEHIQSVIDTILADRKRLVIPEQRFSQLIAELKACCASGGSPAQLLLQPSAPAPASQLSTSASDVPCDPGSGGNGTGGSAANGSAVNGSGANGGGSGSGGNGGGGSGSGGIISGSSGGSWADHFYWSEQGRMMLQVIPSSFDKVEVCVLLHGRLVDQNRFSYMLEGLESHSDRDNVWHRITAAKKASRVLSGGGQASGGQK